MYDMVNEVKDLINKFPNAKDAKVSYKPSSGHRLQKDKLIVQVSVKEDEYDAYVVMNELTDSAHLKELLESKVKELGLILDLTIKQIK
jgi:hypothetical protein